MVGKDAEKVLPELPEEIKQLVREGRAVVVDGKVSIKPKYSPPKRGRGELWHQHKSNKD